MINLKVKTWVVIKLGSKTWKPVPDSYQLARSLQLVSAFLWVGACDSKCLLLWVGPLPSHGKIFKCVARLFTPGSLLGVLLSPDWVSRTSKEQVDGWCCSAGPCGS